MAVILKEKKNKKENKAGVIETDGDVCVRGNKGRNFIRKGGR